MYVYVQKSAVQLLRRVVCVCVCMCEYLFVWPFVDLAHVCAHTYTYIDKYIFMYLCKNAVYSTQIKGH